MSEAWVIIPETPEEVSQIGMGRLVNWRKETQFGPIYGSGAIVQCRWHRDGNYEILVDRGRTIAPVSLVPAFGDQVERCPRLEPAPKRLHDEGAGL